MRSTMHHLPVSLVFLLCVQICWGNFIDPTDLFNFDEMNVELSKKPSERSKEQKPGESGDGKSEALGSPPSSSDIEGEEPASKSKDNENKVTEASRSLPSESDNQDVIPTQQSSTSKIGDNKVVQEPVERCKDDIKTKAVFTLFQQFVMNFVQLSQGMIDDSSRPSEFCLRIKSTQRDLSVLRKFGQGDDNAVHAAHETLNNLFQSACDLPDFSPVLWLEHKLGLSTTKLSLIVVSLLILFFIVKALTTIRMTRSKVWFAMVAVFISSVSFTWMEMYQKRVADQERVLMDKMNVRCPQYENLNMLERFTNYLSAAVTFQDENCKEFYEAMFISPITQVSPLEAVAVAIVKTVVAPWKIIGEGIKDLIIGLFKDLPAQYASFLMVMMTIIVVFTFLYIPLLAFGYTIRLPLLLSIEPRARPKAARVREAKREKAIKPREEQGQGDGIQDHNATLAPAPCQPQTHPSEAQTHAPEPQTHQPKTQTLSLEAQTHAPKPQTHSPKTQTHSPKTQTHPAKTQTHPAKTQTQSQSSMDHAPSSSIQNEIISSQTRALQKCQEEMRKTNDLSKGPQENTAVGSHSPLPKDSKKGREKGTGTDSMLRSASASHQEIVSEDRKESVPEDMNFVNLQHWDCEESYTELVSSDFNTASEIHDSSDEVDNGYEHSEEENLNVAKECNVKSFEKDLKVLNIRDT